MGVKVCAVVPTLNEEEYIAKCIDSLLAQTVPIDIMVLDGGSTDGTLEILQQYGTQITLLDNPGKRVSNARNLALKNLNSDVTHCLEIIGHSWVEPDHVEKRIADLLELESKQNEKIGAIGCRTESGEPDTDVGGWIEGALRSPIGSGGGQFSRFNGRHRTKIPAFCLHNVEALKSVNGWDEKFITSQDSDLSMRLLNSGWNLWRSDVSCVYMNKRSTLRNWWKMCHRYGFWRTKVLLKHPKRFDIRELLPVIGLLLIFTLPQWWWAPAAYASALLINGLVFSKKVNETLGIPICLIILHTAFTIGLFDGLIRSGKPPSDRS
ncbi:MAG: glycosyltransferase [Candidatus Poseidoniaceae archaeon]|jgi:glycosyltransferase involved in cell wall biosynthesis|nr:glycosyltransferase [Candidatus Poseidoniaceae archaeon]